jgi:hypothetical protein
MRKAMGWLAMVVVLGLACAQEQEEAPAEEAPAEEAPTMQAAMPDTTAEAVWAHLEDAGYQNWSMWPGKDALYAGTEPHGMLLTTYVNESALNAITSGAGMMPAGAIVVKENYMPDSMLAAVTVMFKSEGYNADVGDWFFLKRLTDGTVEASGRVGGCQGCHASKADNDYLFTSSLSQ